jgi:hypothetical protein
MKASKRSRATGLKHGFRSGLEEKINKQLEAHGIFDVYEKVKIEYTVPSRKAKYTPDWVLPSGIFVETKGRFVVADRQKHLLIKAQQPELDIRFVFSNSKAKISKGSKTTYADWCDKHGFIYADKEIPKEWLNGSTGSM